MKKLLLILAMTGLFVPSFSQYNCWIQFKDKNGTSGTFYQPRSYLSEKAIRRRVNQQIQIDSTDLPVSQIYIKKTLEKGLTIKTASKWLNGITVAMKDTSVLSELRSLYFVKDLELTFVPPNYSGLKKAKSTQMPQTTVDNSSGNPYLQIDIHNGRKLHAAGYRGQNIVIGVLDGGFYKANEVAALDSLCQQNRLLGVKNFADSTSDSNFFSINESHGTNVLSIMAANLPEIMIGTAPDASFWLIRTEYSATEYPVEADNWVAGIEFADSVGVDVINSSLGYTEFDYAGMNYTYQTLNGRTSRASIAANLAARKGMIVVNAAGNEGNKTWYYISVPSDADSILCVGAVDSNGNHANFSSYGPSSDGRVKPDLCAIGYQTVIANASGIYAASGTSFATPVIAGLAACVWQALPFLNNIEVIELMKKYSSLYSSPNNSLGYGIPDVFALYDENRINSGVESHSAIRNTYAYFSNATLIIKSTDGEAGVATLYDITGQKLGQWKWDGETNTTDWGSLPKGAYLLSVVTSSAKTTIKVLKKR